MSESNLLEGCVETYELVGGGWLVKTKDGRWLALDCRGVKIYGGDEKVVIHKKKAVEQVGRLIDGDSE